VGTADRYVEDQTAHAADTLRRRGVLIVEQGGRGGGADYTGLLAAGLARLGLPVTIATASDHLFPDIPGVRIVTVFDYVRGHSRPARLARRAGLGPLANGLRFLASLPRLLALSRRHAVTHVQGWEASSLGLIATLVLRSAGAVLVYTAHNTFERRARSLDSARIFPALSRQTIVHTEADRDGVSRPPAVIPHGHYRALADAASAVDPDDARAALCLPADPLVVLLFGVLRPDKGLNDLLDAALELPEWHVLIAGEEHGGLAGAGERLRSPRLARRVTVLEGFQPIEQVGRLFAAADLVALPYRQASQSGVLHLAYGFARPAVAYPSGGLGEAMIAGVTGWICREPSPRALADALREAGVAGRAELRRAGEEGRRWAERTFDWDDIARATEAVYLRALIGGEAPPAGLTTAGGADGATGDSPPGAGAPPPPPPESPRAPSG
jgi:glycosyltransferase involved in cell wall biosynthesis